MDQNERDAVIARIEQLPHVDPPDGYDSVAIAVIDAIFSVGIRYSTVEDVLGRYRSYRREQHADADMDCPADVLEVFRVGDEQVATTILRNRNRTSSVNGILKVTAVRQALALIEPSRVCRAAEMRALLATEEGVLLERGWHGIPGQRSGISWRYFRMLCGVDDVKPDRMILRFLGRALGRKVGVEEAVVIVGEVARATGQRMVDIDHRIWSSERQLRRRTR